MKSLRKISMYDLLHISETSRKIALSWIGNTYLITYIFYVTVDCFNYLMILCYTLSNS